MIGNNPSIMNQAAIPKSNITVTAINKCVAIIGGGPAGLMAAEVIAQAGYAVEIYDAMPSVGRKFLLAGVGGMNITHAEPTAKFFTRYANAQQYIEPLLKKFGANELCNWVHGLGIETFVGSSNRVFPKDMKAAPLLRAWLHRLRELNIKIFSRHKFIGWDSAGGLIIESRHDSKISTKIISPAATVFACGGASWQRLGSDGAWLPLLQQKNICVNSLEPSNCGFDIVWSEKLRAEFSGAQLNAVILSTIDENNKKISIRGEAIISEYGIEGTSVYALSRLLREQINKTGSAQLILDFLPDSSVEKIITILQKPRGKNSLSNFLRKQLNLTPVKLALLRELLTKNEMENPQLLAQGLKNISLILIAARPIDEAISCAGGVLFDELTPELMLKKIPGIFCAGEMLDWEAPTGGYLLTACFSTGYQAGLGVIDFLTHHHSQ